MKKEQWNHEGGPGDHVGRGQSPNNETRSYCARRPYERERKKGSSCHSEGKAKRPADSFELQGEGKPWGQKGKTTYFKVPGKRHVKERSEGVKIGHKRRTKRGARGVRTKGKELNRRGESDDKGWKVFSRAHEKRGQGWIQGNSGSF